MDRLFVKDYLRNHTFRQLEDEHGVCARPNATFDKFSLNYDIGAKSGDPLSGQCRGLVVRPNMAGTFRGFVTANRDWKDYVVGDLDVLARPMDRFYNFGDPSAVELDWSDPGLRVYEKLDGTCIVLYWDPLHDRWHAGTRSVPEADLPIQVGHFEIGDATFSQLFMKALVRTREASTGMLCHWLSPEDGPDKVVHLNKELTYVFELVSPYNQIVVSYPEPRVYLLAARHTATGKELAIEGLRLEHVLRPKTWPIRGVAELAEFVDSADPSQLEGAVVCDSRFGRVKVKNKAYVLAHKAKDTVMSSTRNALEVIILEKFDDVAPLLAKDAVERLTKVQVAYVAWCHSVDSRFSEFRDDAAGSRKRFAELVTGSDDWTAPYFKLLEGRAATAHGWIRSQCEAGKLSASSLDTILSRLSL